MKKWFIWMLAVCFILFGSVFGFYAFKQIMIGRYLASMPVPEIPVTATIVQPAQWLSMIDAIGFIEPKQGVMLSSQEAGVVSDILFESGQVVAAGTLLVRLDADKERADLRSAESRLPSVHLQQQRLQKLAADKLASQEQAETANANYQSLRAEIDSLKATISRREIRAPFKGISGIAQVQPGQYLNPGIDIVRVENIDVMRIRFIISEQDYAHVAVGMPVQIKVSAYPDQLFDGEISAIEPAVDSESGSVQVQASIPNSEQLLRSGMYTEVQIRKAAMQQQIVIPQTAINFTLYGETVYLVESSADKTKATQDTNTDQAGYVVRMQVIKVVERRGSFALIGSGLNAGDQIVTSGQLKLSNGAHVKIVEDETLAPPANLPRR